MNTSAEATVQLKKLMSDFHYGSCTLSEFRESVITLAKLDADLTVRDNTTTGYTLLHHMVLKNKGAALNKDISELLTLVSTLVHETDKQDRTALSSLMDAFYYGGCSFDDFKQSAMVLANQGADITVRSTTSSKSTLLQVFVLNNKDGVNDTDIEALLEKNPELINLTTICGRIPLQELLQKHDTSVEAVDKLLQLGSNLKCVDNGERTLLHTVCATGNLDVAKYLFNKGLDLTAKTLKGSSMWHLVIPYGVNSGDQEQDTAMYEWLCEQELDINQKNTQGKTALHLAAERNSPFMMEWLMQHNADSTIQDKVGKTVLQIVAENGFNQPATALIQLQISPALDNLKVKSESLQKRGETKAFNAANTLHKQLSKSFQIYMDAPQKNKAAFDTLKGEFDDAIAIARPELEKHRSVWWNDFTANLTMHIALLACTLGIGNVVALSYNYYQSGGQSMFFKMTTDSDRHVKNIVETVEQLEQNLFQ